MLDAAQSARRTDGTADCSSVAPSTAVGWRVISSTSTCCHGAVTRSLPRAGRGQLNHRLRLLSESMTFSTLDGAKTQYRRWSGGHRAYQLQGSALRGGPDSRPCFSYAGKTLPKGVFLRIPDLGTVTPATDLLVANCSFLTALSRANTKSSRQSFYPPVDRRLKQRAGWLRRPTALGPRAARIAWRSFRGAAPYADGDVRRRTRCYRVARSTAGPPS
jgi:hypothetical protein